MWKQLFSKPPPGAAENLLTPKRKLFYGLLAFGPGTALAVYLQRVKWEMEARDVRLKDEAIAEELVAEAEKQHKDVVLVKMIDELRTQIRHLEQQQQELLVLRQQEEDAKKEKERAMVSNDAVEKSGAPRSIPEQREKVTLSSTQKNEQDDTVFKEFQAEFGRAQALADAINERVDEKKPKSITDWIKTFRKPSSDETKPGRKPEQPQAKTGPNQATSGIRGRVAQRQQDSLEKNLKVFKAEFKKREQETKATT